MFSLTASAVYESVAQNLQFVNISFFHDQIDDLNIGLIAGLLLCRLQSPVSDLSLN